MTGHRSPLFSPLTIGGVTLRNRFVMPPMQRGMIDRGAPDKRLTDIYVSCAAGGVDLIFSEATMIDHPSARWRANTWIGRDSEATWRRCLNRVRQAGGHMFIQLGHPGAVRADPGTDPAAGTVSPSGLFGEGLTSGRAMTAEDLVSIRDAYVRSACMAREFGASGIEIHCAHGYLLDQFLWSVTNRRTDQYGGSTLAERGRYPAKIVSAIRASLGPDFPISVRLSQFKEIDYAARIADVPQELRGLIELLRDAGTDIFHVSSRRFARPAFEGSDLTLAGWVKSFTDATVITVGSVGLDNDVFSQFLNNEGEAASSLERDIEQLEKRMSAGEFDLVAIGRSLIADNEWPNKVQRRAWAEVRTFKKAMLQRYLDDLELGLVEQELGTELEQRHR